jgi:hypothetical protein
MVGKRPSLHHRAWGQILNLAIAAGRRLWAGWGQVLNLRILGALQRIKT